MRISEEFREGRKEFEDRGLLHGWKSAGSGPDYDSCGRVMLRPREWYYAKYHGLRGELRWQYGPFDVEYDPGLPLPPLPEKQLKAPPAPSSPLREELCNPVRYWRREYR